MDDHRTEISESVRVTAVGHLSVKLVGDLQFVDKTIYDGPNALTELAEAIFASILALDTDAFPTTIKVGTGGNYAVGGSDTGVRVAPSGEETDLRNTLASIPIGGSSVESGVVRYDAVARPADFVGTGINEFGLFTRDGQMLAHVVMPAESEGGPAQESTKTGFEYMIVRWSLTPTITSTSQVSP
jgi:hypothetical protein